MENWNVVVTTYEQGFGRARDILRNFGQVTKTPYFNVLVLRVEAIPDFLEALKARVAEDPTLLASFSRVLPARETFDFQSPDEFDARAKAVVSQWLPQLAGKSFHARMHRHGFKGRLSSHEEERRLAEFALERLEQGGSSARISFQDPDFLLEVVTVSQRAGLSLWSREDGARYPFLRLLRD